MPINIRFKGFNFQTVLPCGLSLTTSLKLHNGKADTRKGAGQGQAGLRVCGETSGQENGHSVNVCWLIHIHVKMWFKNLNKKEKFKSLPTSGSKESPLVFTQTFPGNWDMTKILWFLYKEKGRLLCRIFMKKIKCTAQREISEMTLWKKVG